MMTDFGDKGLVQIRGKANYRCKEHGSDCGTGSLMNKGQACPDCPYRRDKNLFISSPLGVTNYTYYLTENRHVGEIAEPHYLVLDEAHNLEDEILGMVHIDVTASRADDLNISLPRFDSNAQGKIRYWLNETFMPAAEKRDNLLRSQIAVFQDDAKNAPTGSRAKDTADRNAKLSAKEQQSLANLMNNVGNYLDDSNSTGWFAWTGDKGQLTIRPLSAATYAQDLLFKRAPHVLMMSATILDFPTFERNLGISKEDTDAFAAPSDFATSHRRIVYWPSGSMSYREAEATIPNIARRCDLLLEKHAENKGIIHATSYKVNGYLEEYFSHTKHRNRIITHTSKPGAREEAIAKHIASEAPTILLSPSMTEGLDLKGDLSRLQIVTKIPFPALDAYTRFRMERDPAWYAWKTALALVQATGRSVRSEDDWAITVILDSAFEQFLIRNQDILPEWWKAAIEFK
jgi:Rad3-related DNA helicase